MTERPKDTLHDFALQQACADIEILKLENDRINKQLVVATYRELMLRKEIDGLRDELNLCAK